MRRFAALLVACIPLLGTTSSKSGAFDILGVATTVNVLRDGALLPASDVPYLEKGDTIEVSFPASIQLSRAPRWHLVVADMYADSLQHAPAFSIRDADLSRAKPGYVWKIPYDGETTPVIFMVPENGNRYGRGIPEARNAISQLANRALLLRAATFSAGAEAKHVLLTTFLSAMAKLQPGQPVNVHARIVGGAQSVFGSALGSNACFDSAVAESTQYACAAAAITTGYESSPNVDVAAVLSSQLSVGVATYGVLIAALYRLLERRQVFAHYEFVPGAIEPGARSTNVYVSQQPDYDATTTRPSTIVYFEIGEPDAIAPSYAAAPELASCLAGGTLNVAIPFDGSPVYFRSQSVVVTAHGTSFTVPASYDPVSGFSASFSPAQMKLLADGGSAHIESLWGFDQLQTPTFSLVEPHPAHWQLAGTHAASVATGDGSATLTFTDGGVGMGSCVNTITLTDGLGNTIPIRSIDRTKDNVTITLDAARAIGPQGVASIAESGGFTSAALPFSILPAMPDVTSAIAYLPKGTLVLRGSGLKYINTVTLRDTDIVFGAGAPDADGSWTFTALKPATYQPAWEHQTMIISFTLEPPDSRTSDTQVDIEYAPL